MVKVGKLHQSRIMKRYQDISAHIEGFPQHVASYVLHQVLLAQKRCEIERKCENGNASSSGFLLIIK